MKDLSKLIPPKAKTSEKPTQKPQAKIKKQKIIIIAIVCLLSTAIASKFINKHIKKKETKKQIQIAENLIDQQKHSNKSKQNDSQKPSYLKNNSNNKMTFTFYNNLNRESVVVETKTQKDQYKYSYIYQIASFRNMNEATWYLKKIKKVGLEPKFKHVGHWIRMYIGPYESTRAIAPDIIKLQGIGLDGGFTREISKTKI